MAAAAFQSNAFQNNAFQTIAVAASFVAGGLIVPYRPPHGIKYTRDDHVKLKRKIRREQLEKEALLASLSELELAQLQLAEAEAEVLRLSAIFATNPTKVVYDQLAAAVELRDQLALKVAALTEQEAALQRAQELADQQATKAQADAVLAEIKRQQLAGRVSDINLGAANSLAAQQINKAMQMARLMRIAIAPERAKQDALRAARMEQMRLAEQRARQADAEAEAMMTEDEANELIQLGMAWTNQN